MDLIEFTIRVVVALLLGTAIGAEREWHHRMAGLRTNALVAVGAALYVLLSTMVTDELSPTRMAAQVVSGIGFLGAGVIMKEGANIRGLNTAATLWCAAAVGVLAGSGFILQAAIGSVIILTANIFLRSIQRKVSKDKIMEEIDLPYLLRVVCNSEDELHIRSLMLEMMDNCPLTLTSLSSEDLDNPIKSEVNAEVFVPKGSKGLLEQIVKRLSLEKTVSAISWNVIIEA